ncbi:MAG: DNA polymerase III subunit delta [Kiritimatiellia bacterium]
MSKTANIHLIVGEDDYLAEAAARKVLEAAVPPALRQSAVDVVDGRADNMEDQLNALKSCRASVQTPPFLDPVKLTWWKGVTFLPGGGKGGRISAVVKTALEKFADDLAAHPLPDNQFLVVTATKLLKTSLFAKTVGKVAEVVEFASAERSRDRQDAARARLPEYAAAEGLSFEPGAAEAFVAKVGTDTRTIVNELAKLRTYLGGDGTVSQADVAEVCCLGGEEPEIWDLTDAIGQRDARKLLQTLARFEDKQGNGIRLANLAEKAFRDLVVVRDALDGKWLTPHGTWNARTPPEVLADLDAAGCGPHALKSPYLLRRRIASARNFTLFELRVARGRMLKAREQLVSSASATAALVSQELLRILGKPKR